MDITQMHLSFRLQVDKSGKLELPSFEPEEIDFWLNAAIQRFEKTRYTGSDKGLSFEEHLKRTEDLKTLVVETSVATTVGTIKPNSYIATLSALTDKWFILGEEVKIGYMSLTDSYTPVLSGNLVSGSMYKVLTGPVTHNSLARAVGTYFVASDTTYTGGTVCLASSKRQAVTKCTVDTYRTKLDDPYSEHVLHYEEAQPLRLVYQNTIELVTDGNYGVTDYYIRYLKKPRRVNILTTAYTTALANIEEGITYVVSGSDITYNSVVYHSATSDTFVGVEGVRTFTGAGTATAAVAHCDLPNHTHDEIIALATSMVLENIEQPRYQSQMNELNKIE